MAVSKDGLPTKYVMVPVNGYSPSATQTYHALIVPKGRGRRGRRRRRGEGGEWGEWGGGEREKGDGEEEKGRMGRRRRGGRLGGWGTVANFM